jgi:hypothetical protein
MRMHYFDTVNRDEEETMLINTVDEHTSKISAFDLTQAKRSRALQRRIGRPPTYDYIHYVSMNMIPNCPVAIQHIRHVEIYLRPRPRLCERKVCATNITKSESRKHLNTGLHNAAIQERHPISGHHEGGRYPISDDYIQEH